MSSIFDPRWAAHHRYGVASAELCEVEITRQVTPGTWTPETGSSGGVTAILYQGKARWQKIGFPTKRDFVEDSANFQRVRLQLMQERVEAFQALLGVEYEFQPNDKVTLTVNPSNPNSVGEVVYVWGNATSSNAWQYTLTCQQNMKQDG